MENAGWNMAVATPRQDGRYQNDADLEFWV
jgi:hypothetical protein